MDEDRDELRFVACIWCGQWITKKVFAKRQSRQLDDADQCKDCRDVRKYEDSKYFRKTARTSLKLGRIECMAWNGDLDDDWNPIDDDGNLYRAGVRICGAKDCVDLNHIVLDKPKLARTK
jgi:hypothetical protein